MKKEMIYLMFSREEDGTFLIDAWAKSDIDKYQDINSECIKVEENIIEVIAKSDRAESSTEGIERYVKIAKPNGGTWEDINQDWAIAMNYLFEDAAVKTINHLRKHNPEFNGIDELERAFKEEYQTGYFGE